MSATTIEVGYLKGTLPVYANAGMLEVSEDSVTYREKVSGNAWSWSWEEGTRVWFYPPGPSGRFGSFMALGLLGLLLPPRAERSIQVTSGSSDEIWLELPSRNPRPLIVAQRLVDVVPAAAGRVSFREQVLG